MARPVEAVLVLVQKGCVEENAVELPDSTPNRGGLDRLAKYDAMDLPQEFGAVGTLEPLWEQPSAEVADIPVTLSVDSQLVQSCAAAVVVRVVADVVAVHERSFSFAVRKRA